jgi:hypothetical protein
VRPPKNGAGREFPEAGDPPNVRHRTARLTRMHGKVPVNPARGEAQGRIGVRPRWSHAGPQTGVEAQKSKLVRPHDRWNAIIPTKINRERMIRHERHVGPIGQKCR